MKFIALLITFALLISTKSDLPSHCLSSNIEGEWDIMIGDNKENSLITCGHDMPDKNLDHINSQLSNLKIKNKITVYLERPNLVYNKERSELLGRWTMVYDEGFEFNIKEQLFFSFSKYKKISNFPASNKDNSDTVGYKTLCGETFLGWFHDQTNNSSWGCFYGRKTMINKSDIVTMSDNSNSLHNVVQKLNTNEAQEFDEMIRDMTNSDEKVPHQDIYNFLELESDMGMKVFEPNIDFVNKINSDTNSLWKAGVHEEFTGKTYNYMRKLLGITNSNMKNQDQSNFTSFIESTLKIQLKSKSKSKSKTRLKTENNYNSSLQIGSYTPDLLNSVSSSSLPPKNFDWRNVNGVNFDSPIRKQGECGSCYAIAAISVVESRIRIQSKNRIKPLLSVGSAISCSRYNQGCEGGYPYLMGKHGREHGFVEETCQRYSEDDGNCKKECFNKKTYMISDYGYVGDYYGGCSEEAMMKEIYENGPIVVAMNASPELYYYSGGIFTSNARRTEGKYEKNVRPWEFTNHAVVCVGWGEEEVNGKIEKYWILKNSWGIKWGDNGYFKIKKGLASVDAQAVFLTPEIN